jgi:hypothetical protein
LRVLADNRVLDALIHVDPENDAVARPPVNLPTRERVVAEVNAALAAGGVKAASVNMHYLSTGLDVEVVLPAPSSRTAVSDEPSLARVDLDALRRRLGARKLNVLQGVDALQAESSVSTEAGPGETVASAKAEQPHSAT